MKFYLQDIYINGLACAVPSHVIENTDFYDQLGKETVDKFIAMTGVQQSHRTPEEQTASDLCFVAAKELLEKRRIDVSSIGAIVFISQTPDYRLPATACVLHKRLGLSKDCMAFDVNLGCSGYVYGLNIVGSLMRTSPMENALLLFGNTRSKTTSPDDQSSVMLFGDAASATILSRKTGENISGDLKSDGTGFKTIIVPAGAYRNRNASHERTLWGDGNIRSDYDGYMNGTDVFTFSISEVPRQIKTFMSKSGTSPEDYDALILHQANLLILKQISKKLKIPMEKIPVSLDRYGNTSGASVPLMICDAYGERDSGKMRLLTAGFGVGLSWGVADITIDAGKILPVIVTDDYFTEGAVSHD